MACVLVIEDDEVTRKLARRMLVEAGYEVEEAVDGVEGLRLSDNSRPTWFSPISTCPAWMDTM